MCAHEQTYMHKHLILNVRLPIIALQNEILWIVSKRPGKE